MVAGDFGNYKNSLANGATVSLQPGSGVVEDIKSIMVSGACELYWYDSVNSAAELIDAYPDKINQNDLHWQNENDLYLQIKNTSGASVKYAVKYGVLK